MEIIYKIKYLKVILIAQNYFNETVNYEHHNFHVYWNIDLHTFICNGLMDII